jgi:hypothetical protein
MKRKSLLLALMCIMAIAVKAQLTVPYSSVIGVPKDATNLTGSISEDWTYLDADNDSVTWQYAYDTSYFPKSDTGTKYGAYIKALSYKLSDDWLIAPALHLEKGKTYKIGWWSWAKYSVLGYTLSMVQDVTASELSALQATDETATYETALLQKIAAVDKITEVSATKNSIAQTVITVVPTETGDYRIGFHFGTKKVGSGSLYLTSFSVKEDILTPGAITNLTAENNGQDLKVSLSWTLPTVDDGGNALSADALTAVKVYRGENLIATLAGNATSYVDEGLTESGFYTYSVAAVASAEGAAATVTTSYVGPIQPETIPYTADMTDAQACQTFWSAIDANNDGKTWSYYNQYGSNYFQYENYDQTVVEDDYLVSPELIFDKAGTYKLTWTGNCADGHIAFLLSSGKTLDDMKAATTFTEFDIETYPAITKEILFDVAKAGNYYIALHNDKYPSKGSVYYTKGFSLEYVPASEPEYVTITMPTEGYATFCNSKNLDFSTANGVKAYIAEKVDNKISFVEKKNIPANTGVLLIGNAGSYNVDITDNAEALTTNNFVGVSMATVVPAGTYVLMNGTQGIGFYAISNSKEINEWTAYLPAGITTTEFISISVNGGSSVDTNLINDQEENVIYDLNGNKVTNPGKGLYIINHRVVLIK